MGLEEVQMRNLDHRANRAGWLRAAVLGANDGLVSTSSLMIGIAAANKSDFLVTAGLAGIVAGAMSMAVGEYVSVKSQNDIESANQYGECLNTCDGTSTLLRWDYVDGNIRISNTSNGDYVDLVTE